MARLIKSIMSGLDLAVLFGKIETRKQTKKYRYHYKKKSDSENLKADWILVGNDLKTAIKKVNVAE